LRSNEMVKAMGRAWVVLLVSVAAVMLGMPSGAMADLDGPDADRPGAIRGVVVNDSRDPVSRAHVEIVHARSGRVVASATTSERGLFAVRVEPGRYIVRAAKRGEGVGRAQVGVRPGSVVRVRVALQDR
jgi:hypothetical protein